MREDIRETRLANGLTILTDKMPGVRSATLGFYFRAGSRHEPVELNGITHFIEHTVFKGTRRRSALEIAIEQDRLGGNLDAFTTHEETGFVMKVIDDQLSHAFDLLADMLFDPRFDQADLLNEQRVIVEEIKMTEDSPDDQLGDIFHREFFPHHPLGLAITGTPETVRSFNTEVTSSYHRRAFGPTNLIITAAGNVEHDVVADLAAAIRFGNAEPLESFESDLSHGNPILIENRADLEQAHIIIAAPFVSGKSERRYAGDMLSNILGGGTSSRLWQRIREDRGLAYSVGSSTALFNDTGFIAVSAATSPDQVEEVLDITIEELCSIVREGVTSQELSLVKDQARASVLLSLEDSASRSAALANSELVHGRQISVDETLDKLQAVTVDQVKEIAAEFLQTEKLAFVALGDLAGLEVDRDRLAI